MGSHYWLGAILVFLLVRKDMRSSLGDILRALLNPSVIIALTAFFGYVVLETWVGSWAGLWKSDLIKDTIIWTVVTGLALFFKFDQASKEHRFFRRRIATAFGITVFLAFFANLFVLSLVAEILLQPFLAILAVIAERDERHRSVKKIADTVLALIGLSLLAFAIHQLVTNWGQVDKHLVALQMILPIWLTIGVLPLIYLLSLYANYDWAFRGVNWAAQDRWARLRAKAALVSKFHFRSRELHRFPWNWAQTLASAESFSVARRVVDEFRASRRQAAQAVADEQERLRRYAGSDEVDENGRRLDRREFKGTTEALRWLATCHMGWYRNEDRGGRYRADLLEAVLQNDFTRQGLPQDHGITMRVAEDGQAWYAWRRTVTGWCFAIGAAGQPSDQWEYDGPEPPQGFPGDDGRWGDNPFSRETSRNW
ncbi:hypothetical protein KIF24_24130 [Micromonospora sp. Llam7]|uniref:hypothetical protein n=1 Tax=Micromonospora tarapacensis TaxID=2835305 RepID=UPI001C832B9A|nr:hypothetical protein [Micromonospora tarapacensis]MBX7268801.1 hypothetical protein [Micromonospora tarapacensis]